jgi:hypothetical protein
MGGTVTEQERQQEAEDQVSGMEFVAGALIVFLVFTVSFTIIQFLP